MISTGQDGMLAGTTGHKQCEAELPCIENAVMIPDVQYGDRKLASEIVIICQSNYSFPGGAGTKQIRCERVVDEKGRLTTQWQDFGGGCERKF